MAARLHADACHARLTGPGRPECSCLEGQLEERISHVRPRGSSTTGLVVSIFRTTAGEIRFVVEAVDGRLAVFAVEQLELLPA